MRPLDWGAAAIGLLLALLLGVVVAPQHQTPGSATSGDAGLAQQLRDVPGGLDGYRAVALANLDADGAAWAGIGHGGMGRDGAPIDVDTPVELGSITKTFTAALFADAIERGELSPDDTLERHLPQLAGSAAGGVTLASLAQHSSGLPQLGATAMNAALLATVLNDNPYATSDTARLLDDAARAPVAPDQGPVYSNLGISLLGHAVAAAAGAPDYGALLRERITAPLGMHDTLLAADAQQVPADAAVGFHATGTPAPRWTGEGYLPAGSSTFTTLGDLMIWARALLDGTAPGMTALDPTADFDAAARIGWVWITSDGPGGDVTWHNGGTAGFSSILELDRSAGTAWIAVGNTETPVENLLPALAGTGEVPAHSPVQTVFGWALAILALLLGLGALLAAWLGARTLPVVALLAWAAGQLAQLWHSGPWAVVGGWVFGLALAPSLIALALLVARPRDGRQAGRDRLAWLWWVLIGLGVLVGISTAFLW